MSNSKNGADTSYNGPTTINDLCFQVHLGNYALKAFGVLISTANLSEFVFDEFLPNSPGNLEKKELQYGLSLLVEQCLASQEKVLTDYADYYENSDEWRLKTALTCFDCATSSGVGSHTARQKLFEALHLLEQIIAGNGLFRPAATGLRRELLQHPLMSETVKEVA
ncbi:MAG: hypothetical protein GX087_05235 [Desulfobulbaceae bacterium]|nr:hypothetical protein [Desulfobulbaceae bacterium]